MSSVVSLPNHTFTGQALSSERLTSIVHILWPETNNCPSWISRRERMTVENISRWISMKECCRPWWGLNPPPPGLQSDGTSNWATETGHQSCTWHIAWSCSTFLSSIIKIFQRVFELQSGHEINGLSLSNITKGDNAKTKKGRVVILVPDMSSGPVLHFCQVPSKYSKGYLWYRANTKSFSNKTNGDNSKTKKATVVHLVLFYISTRNHQNIPKGIQVTAQTKSFTPTPTLTPMGSVPKTVCPLLRLW